MAHTIDDTCCKMRNCNKCDCYRKTVEKIPDVIDALIELHHRNDLASSSECDYAIDECVKVVKSMLLNSNLKEG